MKTFYHIHINIFNASDTLLENLRKIGFINEPFLYTKDSYAPPIHYSFEHNARELIKEYWEKALTVLSDDSEFRGYIEQEVLVDNYSVKYQEDFKFQSDHPFPLPKLKFISVPIDKHKRSDLHVKRTRDLPDDELDGLLLECGFYLVKTERHRLYTVQAESIQDMVIIFNLLKEYFDNSGGVKALTLEFVSHLVKFPSDFQTVNFMPKGCMVNKD